MLIDRAVEIRPLAGDLEVGLIDAPYITIASIRGRTRGGGNDAAVTDGPSKLATPRGCGRRPRPAR
jgi:hypothetical protein